jgi:type III secretory pathway component EscR
MLYKTLLLALGFMQVGLDKLASPIATLVFSSGWINNAGH